MISPRPSPDNSTPKPGFPMRPFFGIDPAIVDPVKVRGDLRYTVDLVNFTIILFSVVDGLQN